MEGDDASAGGELRLLPARDPLGHLGRQSDLRARSGGVVHLGGHRALPDELVEAQVVPRQLPCRLLGCAEGLARGPDRLMGLLRVLHLALVAPRRVRHVGGAVHLAGLGTGRRQRLVRQRRRVGAHVGDEALLVEALGHLHRALGAEAELAPGLLLQRRGHEGGGGRAPERPLGHRADGEVPVGQRRGDGGRLLLAQNPDVPLAGPLTALVEVLAGRDRRAIERDERGPETRRRLGVGEGALDPPPRRRAEAHAGPLPLDHHAGGDTLDPPGRKTGQDLAPQHR